LTLGERPGPESQALLREIEACLAKLRLVGPAPDLDLAERIAGELRRLVFQTARSSAVDRARVRAAVRYFASRAFAVALVGGAAAGTRAAVSARTSVPGRSALPGRAAVPGRPTLRLVRDGAPRSLGTEAVVVGEILRGVPRSG
jgi:hypothetical protein